jgi:hypothetical protein
MSLREKLRNLLNKSSSVDSDLREHNKCRKRTEKEFLQYHTPLQKVINDMYADTFLQNNGVNFKKIEDEIENSKYKQIANEKHIDRIIIHKVATFGLSSDNTPDNLAINAVKEHYKNNNDAINYLNRLPDYERCQLIEKKLNSKINDKRYVFNCNEELSHWLIYDRYTKLTFQTDSSTTLEFSRHIY